MTEEEPASIAFSISSFITDAGLSTTSPAAMSSAISFGRTLIFGMASSRYISFALFVNSYSTPIASIGVKVLTSSTFSFSTISFELF